jgi:hypothetical protein
VKKEIKKDTRGGIKTYVLTPDVENSAIKKSNNLPIPPCQELYLSFSRPSRTTLSSAVVCAGNVPSNSGSLCLNLVFGCGQHRIKLLIRQDMAVVLYAGVERSGGKHGRHNNRMGLI